MRRSTEDWADELESRPIATGLKWWFGAIALIVVTVVLLFVFGVVTAPWKGKGDAYQQKNTSANWVAAQRAFHQQYNDIQAYKAKIAAAKRDLDDFEHAHPNLGNGTPYDPLAQQDQNLRTTLTGLGQQCQNTVTGYNTDAQSYLTQDFRDAGLPDRLDPSECTVPG